MSYILKFQHIYIICNDDDKNCHGFAITWNITQPHHSNICIRMGGTEGDYIR